MGSLRDEMIKKGLISDKRAKQLSHKEKARKNKLGRQQVEQERDSRQRELEARRKSRRQADREREQARQQEAEVKQERHALIRLLADNAMERGLKGARRFHFVTRAQRIPFLELSEQAAGDLEQGRAAICEIPDTDPERFIVVPAEIARRARDLDPDYVLFFRAEAGRN